MLAEIAECGVDRVYVMFDASLIARSDWSTRPRESTSRESPTQSDATSPQPTPFATDLPASIRIVSFTRDRQTLDTP